MKSTNFGEESIEEEKKDLILPGPLSDLTNLEPNQNPIH